MLTHNGGVLRRLHQRECYGPKPTPVRVSLVPHPPIGSPEFCSMPPVIDQCVSVPMASLMLILLLLYSTPLDSPRTANFTVSGAKCWLGPSDFADQGADHGQMGQWPQAADGRRFRRNLGAQRQQIDRGELQPQKQQQRLGRHWRSRADPRADVWDSVLVPKP